MSRVTGGKVGRPAKIPTPEILRAPRPNNDPIAAVLWDIEGEAAKAAPNATRAGLLKGQLDALLRDRDRADGIAKDEQRIELEAARISIDELNAKYDAECAESEASIKELDRECDELYEKATAAEAKVTETIAAASHEREAYLKDLHAVTQSAEAEAERCVRGECPSSQARQKVIEQLRGPAAQWLSWDKDVKSIEAEQEKVIAARAHRAAILARAAEIKARPEMTASEIATGLAFTGTEFGRRLQEEREFFAENGGIIAESAAEDAAAKVTREKAEAAALKEKEREWFVDKRSFFGPARFKVMLAASPALLLRYEALFGPDPVEPEE